MKSPPKIPQVVVTGKSTEIRELTDYELLMERMKAKIPQGLARPDAMLLAWYLADVGLIDQAQHILDLYPEPIPVYEWNIHHSWIV